MMKDDFKNLGLGSTLDLYTSLSKKMEAISGVNNMIGLSGLSSINRQQELLQKSVGLSSSIGLSAIQKMHNSLNSIRKQVNSFQPFTTQLIERIKQQESISNSMVSLSSLSFSNNFLKSVESLKKQTIPDFSKVLSSFASIQKQQVQLGEALPKYLTNSLDFYIRQRIETEDNEVDSITNDIEQISTKLNKIIESQNITKDDVAFINTTLKKSDTSAFIFFIIQVVLAILLSLNSENSQQSNINITINNQEKKEIERGFSETLNILSVETRKALNNVNLRSKPNSNSAKIGFVSKSQIVLVQEINHKWIRIVYQDDEYMIQSGWVFKKYFEKIN